MCGHNRPNNVQVIGPSHKFEMDKQSIVKVDISSGSTVQATDASGKTSSGTWFMAFEQALVVELDSGVRYVANMRY